MRNRKSGLVWTALGLGLALVLAGCSSDPLRGTANSVDVSQLEPGSNLGDRVPLGIARLIQSQGWEMGEFITLPTPITAVAGQHYQVLQEATSGEAGASANSGIMFLESLTPTGDFAFQRMGNLNSSSPGFTDLIVSGAYGESRLLYTPGSGTFLPTTAVFRPDAEVAFIATDEQSPERWVLYAGSTQPRELTDSLQHSPTLFPAFHNSAAILFSGNTMLLNALTAPARTEGKDPRDLVVAALDVTGDTGFRVLGQGSHIAATATDFFVAQTADDLDATLVKTFPNGAIPHDLNSVPAWFELPNSLGLLLNNIAVSDETVALQLVEAEEFNNPSASGHVQGGTHVLLFDTVTRTVDYLQTPANLHWSWFSASPGHVSWLTAKDNQLQTVRYDRHSDQALVFDDVVNFAGAYGLTVRQLIQVTH